MLGNKKTHGEGTERRRHPRLDVDLPVILRHNGRLIPATALNISCGGMCLSADNPNIVETGNVEVIFDLDTGERDVTVRGKIVHIKSEQTEKTFGVQFTNLYTVGHQVLERYIKGRMH